MRKHTGPARVVAAALSVVLTLGALPVTALADVTDADMSDLQAKVESSGAAYDEACAKVEALNVQIQENQDAITEVEAQLPEQRQKAAAAINASYKLQQNTPGLVEMVLSASDFNEFLSTIAYLNAIQGHNADEAARLVQMENELARNQTELEQKQAEAQSQRAAAEEALSQAKAAREEAQRLAEEQARREAEEAARAVEAERAAAEKAQKEAEAKAAQDAAQQEAAQQPAQQAPVNQPAQPQDVPTQNAPSNVDWSSDKSAFVAKWQPRIDAYLSGSPMAGTGRTFAEAAWDYGVDPRWSPAISYVESSKGAVCFRPYNAWGWGNASWSNWDEAIRAHVRGLANGYGPTLTYAAAKKYCPPNADHWYSTCLAQMEMI